MRLYTLDQYFYSIIGFFYIVLNYFHLWNDFLVHFNLYSINFTEKLSFQIELSSFTKFKFSALVENEHPYLFAFLTYFLCQSINCHSYIKTNLFPLFTSGLINLYSIQRWVRDLSQNRRQLKCVKNAKKNGNGSDKQTTLWVRNLIMFSSIYDFYLVFRYRTSPGIVRRSQFIRSAPRTEAKKGSRIWGGA